MDIYKMVSLLVRKFLGSVDRKGSSGNHEVNTKTRSFASYHNSIMASTQIMDSSDDDVYDDAISTPAPKQKNQVQGGPGNIVLGEELKRQSSCPDSTGDQLQNLLDTGQKSEFHELATVVETNPSADMHDLTSVKEQSFLYDKAKQIPESPNFVPKTEQNNHLVKERGSGSFDLPTDLQETDFPESLPKPCQGVPFSESDLDLENQDRFVYDLAMPFPAENKNLIEGKMPPHFGLQNNSLVLEENSRKGDNSVSVTENARWPAGISDDDKKNNINLEGSGIYEPIMSPEERYKTAKMYPSELERTYEDMTGKHKWDTLKRGASLSMENGKEKGWPPNPDDFQAKTGTMYTDVCMLQDSDEEIPEYVELSPDYSMSDSSEFEDIDNMPDDVEEVGGNEYELNTKPLPPKPDKKGNIFKRIKIMSTKHDKSHGEEISQCLPVQVNAKKHPPPELPPLPKDLATIQAKKRHVIQSIIDSERSYIDSLQRIEEVYHVPLLQRFNLDKTILRDVFQQSKEILSHHRMFQIELAECVKNWDKEEQIGNIFTASFSRAMVIDAYSDYVNKFSQAMDEIKNAQNTKPHVREFLKKQMGCETPQNNSTSLSRSKPAVIEVVPNKEMTPDRLSIFGLMVKPVQRFPQFIMFMQDLLKYTPSNHHDRCAIQRALTELENVAHRLNESKRESEQFLEAKRLLKKLPRTFPHRPEKLLRQDDFEQLESSTNGEIGTKRRRLFLMDDCLICVKVLANNKDSNQRRGEERFRPKSSWMPPPKLVDLELKDSAISPTMHSIITSSDGNRKIMIQNKVPVNLEEDPLNLYEDLNHMMHDLTILGKISALVSSLKREYDVLTEDMVHETVRDLQLMIQVKDQQLQLLNSCTITLHDSAKNIRYTFQTARPEMKQEWCKDFLMAKFALEPINRPGWMKCEENSDSQPAVFMKSVSVDMPRNFSKMRCAVPVFLSATGTVDIGIQHLWVAMTTKSRTYVALVSTQSTKPSLVESFKAADEEVVAIELVEGFAVVEHEHAYNEDTVWMSTVSSEIIVYSLYSESGRRTQSSSVRKPRSQFYCHGIGMVIRSCEDRVFVGLSVGNLLIYDRNEEGVWNVHSPHCEVIDTMPIRCILTIDENVWLSCRDTVYMFPVEENTYKEKKKMGLNQEDVEILEMVRSGVGVWVSYKDSSKICLFHMETKEILQELNVRSAVERMVSSYKYTFLEKKTDTCCVTALMASRGFLWVGTNLGMILTVTLPRLRDGVPRIWDKPWVSCHAHNGPVKFLIPIYCDTVNIWNTLEAGQFPAAPTAMMAQQQQNLQDSIKVQVLPKSKEDSLPPPSASSTWQQGTDERDQTHYQRSKYICGNTGNGDSDIKHKLQKELVRVVNSPRMSPMRTSVHTLLDKASPEEEINLLYSDLLECDDESDSSQNVDIQRIPRSPNDQQPDDLLKEKEAVETKPSPPSILKSTASVKAAEPPHIYTTPRTSKSVMIKSANKISRRRSSVSLRLPQGTFGPRVSAIDTLRKRNCNAVMVVSGGDGYLNCNVEQKDTRNDEASLMMWMYKF